MFDLFFSFLSLAYDSEDVKETTVPTDDIGSDGPATEKKPKGTNDLQDELKNQVAEQDSTAELSGHDADGESHISESSEPTSDAESTSIKNKDEATRDFLKDGSEDSVCSSDSLQQMKTIYKSFLNNPYWSFLSLNSSQLYAEEQPANSSGSSSKIAALGAATIGISLLSQRHSNRCLRNNRLLLNQAFSPLSSCTVKALNSMDPSLLVLASSTAKAVAQHMTLYLNSQFT